ncbi:MAG: helix-turn-helix domain-containing protein [Syntrophales bacterium]|jgi:DNA-binding transcriptional regulator YhcF (GntR family)
MDHLKILQLKAKGKSLREIASILGVSHEAVRKRLKNLANIEKLSTKERNQELTVAAIEKEKVSTGSNAHKSSTSEEIKDTVNRVSTQKTPSHTLTEGVNPLGTPSDKHPGCMKGVFQDVDSESGDLFEGIKDFLEANGIEVYRMNVEQEAYQVTDGMQVVRFYVHKEEHGKGKEKQ